MVRLDYHPDIFEHYADLPVIADVAVTVNLLVAGSYHYEVSDTISSEIRRRQPTLKLRIKFSFRPHRDAAVKLKRVQQVNSPTNNRHTQSGNSTSISRQGLSVKSKPE